MLLWKDVRECSQKKRLCKACPWASRLFPGPEHDSSKNTRSNYLENLFLGTLRPEDPVEGEVDLPVVLGRALDSGVLDADLFRVVRKVRDERAARGLRRSRLAAGGTFWRQACLNKWERLCDMG